MACAIGLQIGLNYIGKYYDCEQLAGITGIVSHCLFSAILRYKS